MEGSKKNTLQISKHAEGSTLTVCVEGSLDAVTVKDLNAALLNSLTGVELLILNFENLRYVSSAGLRTILIVQKTMSKQGTMKILGANDTVKEIFHSVGFDKILSLA